MGHPLDTLPWPVHTGRLLLRRGTPEDVDATWAFRRLPEVHEWLGAATATYDAYRERYFRPKRLADLIVVELDGRVIGDLMLKVEDGWAQEEVTGQAKGVQGNSAGPSIPPSAGRGTRPRRCAPWSACASGRSGCGGCTRTASSATSRPGG